MVNLEGSNQWGGKLALSLSDDALRKQFEQFSREKNGAGLSIKEQQDRLKALGCAMSRTYLFKLRARLGIRSVRKEVNNGRSEERVQAILDIKQNDIQGRWGVAQVRQRLANQGVLIRRSEVRDVLHDHYDHEFDRRFPGRPRQLLPRTPLNCLGPMHQVHVDGHEKLSSQALRLGPVTLPIYAYKDQWGSYLYKIRVLPNVRLSTTCVHIHLDFAEEYGCVPLTVVSDKGSETGKMMDVQRLLRHDAAPEISEDHFQSWVQVQSKHNTPIEGFWLWLRQGEGHNIREVVLSGAAIFNSNDSLHVDTFNWLWPSLVQSRLDEYRTYWNNHTIRSQKEKDLPSGTSPMHMWSCPTSVRPTARDCRINVRASLVHELREQYGGEEGRRMAFEFVSPEFRARADGALVDLGITDVTLANAWNVFSAVVNVLRT